MRLVECNGSMLKPLAKTEEDFPVKNFWLIFAIGGLLSLTLSCWLIVEYMDYRKSALWHSVTVDSAELEVLTARGGVGLEHMYQGVKYTYHVDGKTFAGAKISFGLADHKIRNSCHAWKNNHPHILFNPDHPNKSVIYSNYLTLNL